MHVMTDGTVIVPAVMPTPGAGGSTEQHVQQQVQDVQLITVGREIKGATEFDTWFLNNEFNLMDDFEKIAVARGLAVDWVDGAFMDEFYDFCEKRFERRQKRTERLLPSERGWGEEGYDYGGES